MSLCAGLTRAAEPAGEFHADRLEAMEAAIQTAIQAGQCPGGVIWLERKGSTFSKALGRRAVTPTAEAMTLDTIFDAASLTKVLATTPAILKLIEEGRLEVDAPVRKYLPHFSGSGRDEIHLRHLLTHTSGLRAGLGARGEWQGYERGIELALEETPTAPPGTSFRYSDINFILLGEIVRQVSGLRLDQYCQREIFAPLGLVDTGFLPEASRRDRIAPTERLPDGTVLRGVVHDPTARRMGGVAGHAGLFTTASDIARFARMLLNGGHLDGRRLLRPETVQRMTQVQSPDAVNVRRGFGWDIDSPYAGPRGAHFPLGSYGHTGWTGTSVWIDPFSETFVIFLSNRNHPTAEGNVIALRRTLGTLAAEAVRNFNWLHVPGALASARSSSGSTAADLPEASVLNGIDVLARDGFRPLRGKRVGLVTNHTGVDRERRPTIDLLHQAPEVQLVALFSPEHGIRGMLDAKVSDGRDERTGLPIYSLYGEHRAPQPNQLAGLDVLVFDIQDIGCRFYTYISTLGECLQAAALAKVPMLVLDRVNPIGGRRIEGPLLEGTRSFVGWHELPVRHGLTTGELAKLFAAERQFGGQLTVIACEGWKRDLWFDQTGLPWVNTSPNMRSPTEALLYPGVGLIEMCHVSVGRGTDTPFERVGAPYVNDRRLATELNALRISGIRVVPIRFTPTASKFQGQECGGVQFWVTDRESFRPVELGIGLAATLHRLHPAEFGLGQLNRLLFHPATVAAIEAGRPWTELRDLAAGPVAGFAARREKFLLYK